MHDYKQGALDAMELWASQAETTEEEISRWQTLELFAARSINNAMERDQQWQLQ